MPREKTEYEIKDESFVALQGWMLTELGLKGNELIIYALLYGFTQTYNIGYTGGINYLALWTNSTRQSVHKVLKSLSKKGLICQGTVKVDNVNLVYIKALKCKQSLHQSEDECKQSLQGCKQSLHEMSTKFTSECKQSLHTHYNINNNISNNIDDKDNNNITVADKSASVCVKKSKTAFQKPTQTDIMVYITENQLQVNSVQFYNYYEANGWRVGKNPMRDWRAALRNWHINSIQKNQQQPKSNVEKYKFVINDFDDESKESN